MILKSRLADGNRSGGIRRLCREHVFVRRERLDMLVKAWKCSIYHLLPAVS